MQNSHDFIATKLVLLIRFNVTFLHLRHYQEEICICFQKDAEGVIMHGCLI